MKIQKEIERILNKYGVFVGGTQEDWDGTVTLVGELTNLLTKAQEEAVKRFVEYVKEHHLNKDNEFMSDFEQGTMDILEHNYLLELPQLTKKETHQSLDKGDGE